MLLLCFAAHFHSRSGTYVRPSQVHSRDAADDSTDFWGSADYQCSTGHPCEHRDSHTDTNKNIDAETYSAHCYRDTDPHTDRYIDAVETNSVRRFDRRWRSIPRSFAKFFDELSLVHCESAPNCSWSIQECDSCRRSLEN